MRRSKTSFLFQRKPMVVRLLLVLCFVLAPFQWVGAQVTLSKGNTTLGTVIQQIQKQTNYKFFYDDDIANTRVSGVDVKNVSVSNGPYKL